MKGKEEEVVKKKGRGCTGNGKDRTGKGIRQRMGNREGDDERKGRGGSEKRPEGG